MKHKINEWLKRYLPAEIISMILTVVSAELAIGYTENKLTTALVATVIGNMAYFRALFSKNNRRYYDLYPRHYFLWAQ